MPTVLISDYPAMVAGFQRVFGNSGLTIIGDGECEAPAVAERVLPDLVLIELDQPVSGHQLLERLKANPATAGIPVVMLSSVADLDTRLLSYELGAVEHICKPLPANFFSYVRRLSERRALEARRAA